jgi:hypothetical protein
MPVLAAPGRLRTVIVVAICVASTLGCPGPDDGECDGDGDLAIELRPNHGDTSPIDDGSALAIFPPPQGGVFTELDVELRGLAEGELGQLQIRITRDDGASLSTVTYQGSGLPLLCQDGGALSVTGLPVGFDLTYALDDLDGDAATLTVDVITAGETLTESWPITLTVVEY